MIDLQVQYKRFTPRVKAARGNGSASFVVATLGVEDLDGDVAQPGFFGRQVVPMVPVHDWQHVPIGKGVLYEADNEALVDVEFNMSIPSARDWYESIRFDAERPPATQQYSYGYNVLPGGSRMGQWLGRTVRFLQPRTDGSPGAEVFEVSPVLRGVGVGVRTVSVGDDGKADLRAIRDRLRGDEAAAVEYVRFARHLIGAGR